MQKILKTIQSISPPFVLFFAMTTGLILVIASFALEISSFINPIGKELGYFYSINWSVNFLIVVPLIFAMILFTFQNVNQLLEDLYNRDMLVNANWENLKSIKPLQNFWNKKFLQVLKLSIIFLAISTAVSLIEWIIYSGYPLIANDKINVKTDEIDWSVASLYSLSNNTLTYRIGNAAFSFVAFLYQAILAGALLGYFSFIAVFSNFIYELTYSPKKFRLVLNIKSNDERLGFHVFEKFIEKILLTTLLVFTAIYISRLQNLYMRHEESNTIFQFLQTVYLNFEYYKNPEIGDWSSFMGSIGALVSITFVLFLPIIILRNAATKGREEFEAFLDKKEFPSPFNNIDQISLNEKLKNMKVWPMSYLTINELLIYAMFSFICIIFYQIGTLLLAIMGYTIISQIIKKIKVKINEI